ncbi:hypothetical protein GCM10011609_16230 [Lentzea pudingi]|uniref:Uncharacterized protein n=1 Tax=Lentzea pudingi TaxID=1789439 RepID=A0ABQ2HIQ6_9PSEU|nr:hypothetical protein [Lentzea pudingi]GGM81010.1 hypothetical protein GCM10011609_16230 [Lentzea pudingi]
MGFHVVLTENTPYPVADPLAVVRVGGGREETFDPVRGWVRADPRYREWFSNTRISEADEVIARVGPPPSLDDEKWNPRNAERTMNAIEGYGDVYLRFAVEDGGHPFDDPVDLVHEQLYGNRVWLSCLPDLSWSTSRTAGRLVRITEEESDRIEEVLARRVFGDAEFRHFAVVDREHPRLDDPYLLLREHSGVDAFGHLRLRFYERYDENREWVPVGRQSRTGKPVVGKLLDHLLTSWTPPEYHGQ